MPIRSRAFLATVAGLWLALVAACTPPAHLAASRTPTPWPTIVAAPPSADAGLPAGTVNPADLAGDATPLHDVLVGLWCTDAVQGMAGTTMQCLAITGDGAFRLGVIVDGNVHPQSVLTGTYATSAGGVSLTSLAQGTVTALAYQGAGDRPTLVDATGKFAFHPFGRPGATGDAPVPAADALAGTPAP